MWTLPGIFARILVGFPFTPLKVNVASSRYSPGRIVTVSPAFIPVTAFLMVRKGAASEVPGFLSEPLTPTKYSCAPRHRKENRHKANNAFFILFLLCGNG